MTKYSRDNSQRRKRVRSNLRFRIRQTVEDRRLAHAGKTDEDDRRISTFANLESRSTAFRGRGFKLCPQPSELCLEETYVVFCMFVNLGLLHLLLNLFDLLRKTHTAPPHLPSRGKH